MEHQAGIKDAGRQWVGLPLGEHVEEIGGVGQVIPWLDGVLTPADHVERGQHRWDLGQHAHHGAADVVLVIQRAVGIKEPQRCSARLQGIHRVPPRGEALEHVADAKTHPAVHLHVVLELPQSLRTGQFTPNQQIGRFQEGAVGGQILNAIAAVAEDSLLAIDVADRRLGGRHPLQSRAKTGGSLAHRFAGSAHQIEATRRASVTFCPPAALWGSAAA